MWTSNYYRCPVPNCEYPARRGNVVMKRIYTNFFGERYIVYRYMRTYQSSFDTGWQVFTIATRFSTDTTASITHPPPWSSCSVRLRNWTSGCVAGHWATGRSELESYSVAQPDGLRATQQLDASFSYWLPY